MDTRFQENKIIGQSVYYQISLKYEKLTSNRVNEFFKPKLSEYLSGLRRNRDTQHGCSHRKYSVKKGVLENFANFTAKHLCWDLFSTKLQTFSLATS